MTHYPEKQLIQFVSDPSADLDRANIEHHLRECEECRSLVATLRDEQEALSDSTTWLLTETPAAAEFDERLQSMFDRAAIEDEEAASLLGQFINYPDAIAFADLPSKRKYHTAGVVRFLCRAARDLLGRSAADALILADNAIAIAEALDEHAYP